MLETKAEENTTMQHIPNTEMPLALQDKETNVEDRSQEQNKPSKTRSARWEIVGLFLVTRVMLVLVTYFGYILLTQPKYSSAPVHISVLLGSWYHWDAIRYLNIAQMGYHTLPFDLAFFPLFPLLIIAFGFPFGPGSYLLIGMIISNLALLGTMFFLYTLASEMGDSQTGRRTLLYLCIFPTAFFFFAAYNESLFLFFTIGGFVALRRQHWWLAGLAGALSALTRSAGLILVAPFLYELWVQRQQIKTNWFTLLKATVPILLIPLGTALYCLYNWQLTGNPITFASVQWRWARFLSWPWEGIKQNILDVFWQQPFGSFYQVHSLIDLVMTLGFLALTILGWRKLRTSYSIWLSLLFLYVLISPSIGQDDALISNQRFVLEMFPAFITLALLGQRYTRLHQTILWAFPVLLGIFSLLFVLGKWMV